ncbi:hypothetical protein [Streptomyces cathayae]|uniref:HNH nuclease domain-containing protein n=1 Tax=Streptomyces cathayae TaxID=3031124 RepID=A0ABY8KAC6_9ACTN|nr:hypothetical protein [Streptomyces sp. HUAS 5]WGD45136.1 hypothetical protein PYS65_34145 [Streptomyces sp. HUAS 5]
MIPLQRVDISAHAQSLLTRWTQRVESAGATGQAARELWGDAKAPKKHVRSALESMARGAVRCMYCDDSRGTDIDHFEPLERAPLRAFVWVNHLLACSFCNSNTKNRKYPVDAKGDCLLVDPTAEDPADHLTLRLSVGTYDPLSPKGEETIRVFGLNRSELVKGRVDAFVRACSILRDWHGLRQNAPSEADRVAQALLDSPFIDVVHAMTRLKPSVAAIVVGQATVPALDAWRAAHSLSFRVGQPRVCGGAADADCIDDTLADDDHSCQGRAGGRSNDERVITMQNYGLTWTDPTGTPCSSAVAYDEPSAQDRKAALESGGCTSVEIVAVRPGELPEPRG